jgi:hypothetical protein
MWHLGLTYCVYPLDPLGMEAPPLQDVGGVTQGAWVGILGEISPPWSLMGSGCAAMPISVPQPTSGTQKYHEIQ